MSWGLIVGEHSGAASLQVPPGLEKDAGPGSTPLAPHPDRKETRGITVPRRKETGPCGLGAVMEGEGCRPVPLGGAGGLPALEMPVGSVTQLGWVGWGMGPVGLARHRPQRLCSLGALHFLTSSRNRI